MDQFKAIHSKNDLNPTRGISAALLFLGVVMALAVLQDFIFSQLKNTGFYISESLLFNTFWLFFLPFGVGIIQLQQFYKRQNIAQQLLLSLGLGLVFCALHLIAFTSFFILGSHLLYDQPHRFSRILSTVVAKHFYLTFLGYLLLPTIYQYFISKKEVKKKVVQQPVFERFLSVKVGALSKSIAVDSIQLISTDRPYMAVHTQDEKYLQDGSLKNFERMLDPTIFIRVHRSAIVNKHFVRGLASRKNGDYDAQLKNGQSIRFSRHWRANWECLLH